MSGCGASGSRELGNGTQEKALMMNSALIWPPSLTLLAVLAASMADVSALGSAEDAGVEFLSFFGPEGQRVHLRR